MIFNRSQIYGRLDSGLFVIPLKEEGGNNSIY